MTDPLSSKERCSISGHPKTDCIHCLFPALKAVAVAAKELSRTSKPINDTHLFVAVSEVWLCEMETALEAAGYGMTEEELQEAM